MSFKRLLLYTFTATHLLFTALLLFAPNALLPKKAHTPLQVHTVVQMAQVQTQTQAQVRPSTPSQTRTQPKPKEKLLSKATTPSTPTKKTIPVPTPAPRAKISDSLLKELETRIAQIELKPSHPHATQPSPYKELLSHVLKEALQLPDYGSVKIELTLHRDGSLATLTVLEAKSDKNKQYLETQLKQLKFPPLPKDVKETKFTLTFSNE
jgi:outer membrane biosynthesis protein TonB